MIRYILALMLISGVALGQTITGTTGSMSGGETVVISGSSFGNKATAAPMKWDDFESGSNGANLESTQSEWVKYLTDGVGATYSSSSPHSGYLSVFNDPFSGYAFETNYIRIAETDKVFISYWYKITNADSGDYGVIKLSRITSSAAAGGGGVYNGAGATILSNQSPAGTSSSYFAYDSGSGYSSPIGYIKQTLNTWNKIDMYVSLGDAGVSNGSGFCDNRTSDRYTSYSGAVNREAGETFTLDTVLLGLMSANNSGQFELYLDDIYIDNTLARVELGDASVFADCTHREIQIPTAWATGEITVTFNQGTFAADDAAYLFVVDSDGTASAGYAITIGGEASVELTAPAGLTAHGGKP